MKKQLIFTALVAIVCSVATFYGLSYFSESGEQESVKIEHIQSNPARSAMYSPDEDGKMVPMDFRETAKKVTPAAVHIKSTIRQERSRGPSRMDPFRRFFERESFPFFDEQPRERQFGMGSGSGVIINPKGYIVTNNHVIKNATDIEVTLHDNRSYKAEVVGTDESTDLALLKIDADDLHSVPIVNSDEVEVGEWVVAVGNPFNLSTTVTAGIVSAKARNININSNRFAVESFIQTDAAINRGNSGGALVNLDGGLVGINTALMSPTGTYSGYGFAVPSNLVSKVVEDLLEYGSVQRGYLGVMIRDLNGQLADEKGLDIVDGVFIDSVMSQSAAAEAGLQSGDVVVGINGKTIQTTPQLQERIARHRPDDKVTLDILRMGKEQQIEVTLKGRYNGSEPVATSALFQKMGIDVRNLEPDEQDQLQLEGGVYVENIRPGIVAQATTMKEGFIITSVNDRKVNNVQELEKELENAQGGVLIAGTYRDNPGVYYYGFGLDS